MALACMESEMKFVYIISIFASRPTLFMKDRLICLGYLKYTFNVSGVLRKWLDMITPVMKVDEIPFEQPSCSSIPSLCGGTFVMLNLMLMFQIFARSTTWPSMPKTLEFSFLVEALPSIISAMLISWFVLIFLRL